MKGPCPLTLLGLVLTLAQSANTARPAREAPFTVVPTGGEPELRLSAALARAVQRGFPQYRAPRASDEDPQMRDLARESRPDVGLASAAAGDFNGDGRRDAVLHLRRSRSREAGLVVAFHGTRAGGYEAHVLPRWQRMGAQFCVTRVRPGAVAYLREGGSRGSAPAVLRLRHDGVELLLPGIASRLYYWDGKRYLSVATSD